MTNRSINYWAYTRAWVAMALLVTWGISAFSGFLLWAAPSGFRSGRALLLFGLSKSVWGDIHFWISAAAIAVTMLHIVVDWKALRACMRYLTSINRRGMECD